MKIPLYICIRPLGSIMSIHIYLYNSTLMCPSYNVKVLNFKLRHYPLFDEICKHIHQKEVKVVHLPFHHSNNVYDFNYVFPLCYCKLILMYSIYMSPFYYITWFNYVSNASPNFHIFYIYMLYCWKCSKLMRDPIPNENPSIFSFKFATRIKAFLAAFFHIH